MSAGQTDKIASWLIDQITTGAFGVGRKIPSEYELATRFSVNKTTANKAVATLVAKGILRRGRGAAGTVVATRSTFPKGTLGIYMAILGASYFPLILQGFQQKAFLRGYAVQLYCPPQTGEASGLSAILAASLLQGLLVTHATLGQFSADYPVVYLNDIPNGYEKDKLHIMQTDNAEGGRLIAEHLMQLGHTHIVCTRQSEFSPSLVERTRGVNQRLAKAGLTQPPVYITGPKRQETKRIVTQILSENPDVTAIATDGDNVALTVIDILREMGKRVPQEISVTGFSNLEEVQRTLPITTVDDRAQEAGMLAADRLIDLIEGHHREMINEKIPPYLQLGTTTCPAPKTKRRSGK